MAEFKSYALDPAFRPRATVDTVTKQAQYAKEQVAQLQEFMNSNRVTDQQRIEDARFVGQDLKALASLTESGTKYFEALAKQDYENKLIGEQWELQMPPTPDQAAAEAENEAEGELENRTVTPIIEGLDPIAQQSFEKSQKRIGAGLYNQKGLHQKVKGLLPGHYTAFLNSTTVIDTPEGKIPAVEAYRSTYPALVQAALDAARWDLIKKYGLQYSTKSGFIKDLGELITSTETYMLTNALNANIKQEQADNLASYNGLAYAAGQQGFRSQADMQQFFTVNSDLAYVGNTGTSRRQANAAILTSMAAGMAASGNIDGVRLLKGIQIIPGQPGTEAGRTFGKEIDEAVAIAQRQDKTNRDNEGQLLYRNMRDELANLPPDATVKERQEVIQKYRKQAQSIQAYSTVDKIDGDTPTLVLSNDVAANDALVLSNVESGTITRADLETQYTAGKISKQAYDKGVKAFDQKEATSDPVIKPTIKRWESQLKNEMDVKLGVKRDPLGGFVMAGALVGLVTPEQLAGYYQAYERDVQLITQQSLARTEGMTPEERSNQLDKDLDAWYKAQVLTDGGKYYNGGFLKTNEADTTIMKNKDKWQDFWRRWEKPSYRAEPTSFPQNLSFNYGLTMPDDVRFAANLNNPDTLLSFSDTDLSKTKWEEGIADDSLRLASADLGVAPLTFINSQLEAHDQTTFKPTVSPNALAKAKGKPRIGVQLFEQVGFPTKGASYLSAAVATKVGWEDPKSMEIDNWPQAMQEEFPVEFTTLMTPQATDRQLQLAVERIFGPLPTLGVVAQNLYA